MNAALGAPGVLPHRALGLPLVVAAMLATLLVAGTVVHPLVPGRGLPATPSLAPGAAGWPAVDGLPLAFVENHGQWPAAALFVAQREAMTATFERHAIHLGVGGHDAPGVALTFEGASASSTVVGEQRREGRYNYFVGDDPAAWRAGVPAYASVLYRSVYPGIDVRVRAGSAGADEPLAYDVLAARGAGIDQVVMRAEGASSLSIAEDGALLVHVGEQVLRQAPPFSWEVLPDGRHRPLDSAFRIVDARRYGFVVPRRDPALPLVIDPGARLGHLPGRQR